jgi:2',3'-cyclic-nucleotide 2'-phosphodiesterase/3'-nucleotidase/5'-nucleotidase
MKAFVTLIKTICVLLLGKECSKEEPINLTDYKYPTPHDKHHEYTIAIYGTNDIHGTAFPKNLTHPITKEVYLSGGVEYIASYVKILRNQWKERFLWLDSGDQFQGGIESKISNGTIMTDFFNTIAVNSTAVGNHEFDYGRNFLDNRLEAANFPYIAANILNNATGECCPLPNTQMKRMYTLGEVKIGVIGLTTVETPTTTAGNTTGLRFAAYKDIVVNLSTQLRNAGANAVILNTHVGMLCDNDMKEKMVLMMRDNKTQQADCSNDSEMYMLLKSLDENVVDAVVSGHVHDIVHHWVNNVPVIQSVYDGYYSNILYLTFNKHTKQLIRNRTRTEGPLPTCEKVFTNTKRCDYIPKSEASPNDTLSNFYFHDTLLKKDTSLDVIFAKWWDEIKKYKVVIASNDLVLQRITEYENDLGNLMSDVLRNKTGADISIFNAGAFRTTWFPGSVMIEDVWDMSPFDNNITTFDIPGKDVKKMMSIIQSGSKGFYQTSGLMMNVTTNPHSLIEDSLRLYNGTTIEDNTMYNIATIDFLVPFGGDDFKNVKPWLIPQNLQAIAPVRDAVIDFIRTIGYIKEGMFVDPNHKRLTVISGAK